MTPIFIQLPHLDWKRVWLVCLVAGTFWGSMATVVPAKWHIPINTVLGALTAALGVAIRGNKYVTERDTIPKPGEDP